MTVTEERPRCLMTASEAAMRLHIPIGSIRGWKAKGLLWHWGIDERGRQMFDRDDLIALRDNTHRRVAKQTRKRALVDPRRRLL